MSLDGGPVEVLVLVADDEVEVGGGECAAVFAQVEVGGDGGAPQDRPVDTGAAEREPAAEGVDPLGEPESDDPRGWRSA